MAKRTYEVGLLLALNRTYRYATRWQNQLSANLTTAQLACLTAVIDAVASCIQALGSRTPE